MKKDKKETIQKAEKTVEIPVVKESKKKEAPITLDQLNGWYQFASEAAKKKHWEYFVIDQFLKGNHNVKASPNDNTLVIEKKVDSINFPINRIYSTFRAIRAFVTRHKPKVTVEPENSSDEARQYAKRANKILDRDNTLNNSRRLNKEWVYYGIKYGTGWRQIGYDKTKKVAIRWTLDPWDVLVGSQTADPEDAPFIIKTMVRTVGYWKSKYPNTSIVPDNELAADEYKKLSMSLGSPSSGNAPHRLDEQTALGMECWYRVFEENSLGGTINKCLFTKGEILEFEETPYTEYPFVRYTAEVSPNDPQPDGHIKQLIAPQRMLNLLNTQLLEYNHLVNRGRFLMDKNAGFRVIQGKEGQIIQKNPGKTVTSLQPPPISQNLTWQIAYADSAIEDIGGQHDASQGSVPSRVSSGAAIEALQLGDSNNISDYRDNFEDSLAQEAAWILKMYSLFEDQGVVVENKEGNKTDRFAVIGKKAMEYSGVKRDKYYIEDNGEYCDVCAILPDNQIKASVISELGETKAARTDLLFKLLDYGVPLKVVLENLEFPGVSDVMSRMAEEVVAESAMPNIMTPPQTQPTPQDQDATDEEVLQGLEEIEDSI